MINNRDQIGDFRVSITSQVKVVNSFQCATIEDAREMAMRIVRSRRSRKLPVREAYAQKIVGKGGPLGKTLLLADEKINLLGD